MRNNFTSYSGGDRCSAYGVTSIIEGNPPAVRYVSKTGYISLIEQFRGVTFIRISALSTRLWLSLRKGVWIKIKKRESAMVRVCKVEIRNFRSIRLLTWQPSPGLNCLIGPGDSGKTTILDAIDLCLGRGVMSVSATPIFLVSM